MKATVLKTVLLIAVGALVGFLAWNRDLVGAEAVHDWLTGFGAWAPVAFVGVYALATVAYVPGLALTLAGGALFGPVLGTMLNLAGATLGATLAFLVARYVARDWVAARAGPRLGRLLAGVDAEGWRFVALVRLVPLFPFNLTNYALGLTRIGTLPYVVTSAICMLPGGLAYTRLGYAGRQAAGGDASAIRYGLLALGLLAAIALLPRIVRRTKLCAAGAKGTGT